MWPPVYRHLYCPHRGQDPDLRDADHLARLQDRQAHPVAV